MTYNKTQLNPEKAFERHVFHRDQFAHYLRWSFILNNVKIGIKILDFGCGSGNLAEVLYRNRFKAKKYLGVDIRKLTIKNNIEKYKNVDWINFKQADLCDCVYEEDNWDLIVSFEVIEHIGKQNIHKFLTNIINNCRENTKVIISSPNYDEKVGAADNHTFDSGDGRGIAPQEFDYYELYSIFDKYFKIIDIFGTFASQKNYKQWVIDNKFEKTFNRLKSYFDSNLISVIMAPIIPPEKSRNVMWVLQKK